MNFILDQHAIDAIQDGRFSFAYGISPWLFALLVLGLIGLVVLLYRKTTRALSPAWKIGLISLRSAVLIILLFCLLRPIVTTEQVIPQESYLAVLVDDSQSMTIEDESGSVSRAQAVSQLLNGDSGVLNTLSDTFQIRTFRFDKETQRVVDSADLSSTGTASSIDQALE